MERMKEYDIVQGVTETPSYTAATILLCMFRRGGWVRKDRRVFFVSKCKCGFVRSASQVAEHSKDSRRGWNVRTPLAGYVVDMLIHDQSILCGDDSTLSQYTILPNHRYKRRRSDSVDVYDVTLEDVPC